MRSALINDCQHAGSCLCVYSSVLAAAAAHTCFATLATQHMLFSLRYHAVRHTLQERLLGHPFINMVSLSCAAVWAVLPGL